MGWDHPSKKMRQSKMNECLKSVMLVDDDELLSEFAMAVLERDGIDVVYCDSGKAALGKLGAARPQLILLDYLMPGLNGPETLSMLRNTSEGKDVPVVFLTGKSQHDADDNALTALGAVGVVRKPLDPGRFSSQVQDLWYHHAA